MKRGMRFRDWASFAAAGLLLLAIAALAAGWLLWAAAAGLALILLGGAARISSLRQPAPLPHSLSWVLFLPRGHSPQRLHRVLAPGKGERILELGPGVGIHAIPTAVAVGPQGFLAALDLQRSMLKSLAVRAASHAVENIRPVQGDALRLPFRGGVFDAVSVVSVLGEVPDATAVLRELQRVLKPDGRLVIGEVLFDADYVPFGRLRRQAAAAGLALDGRRGTCISYFARFRCSK